MCPPPGASSVGAQADRAQLSVSDLVRTIKRIAPVDKHKSLDTLETMLKRWLPATLLEAAGRDESRGPVGDTRSAGG